MADPTGPLLIPPGGKDAGSAELDPHPAFGLPIGSSVAQSTDKACKQDALVNLKVQSAQPTLSYRVGPSLGTAWHLANPL